LKSEVEGVPNGVFSSQEKRCQERGAKRIVKHKYQTRVFPRSSPLK